MRQLSFTPDSKSLVVVSGAAIEVYDAGSLEPIAALESQAVTRYIDDTPAALSPDGQYLATINKDSTISLWNLAERRQVATLQAYIDPVTVLAFSADGHRLAFGADEGTIIVWEVERRRPLGSMQAENVCALAFSPDGRRLASGNRYGVVCLWDLESLAQVALFRHAAKVTQLGFSPDGSLLASASLDHTVRLWNMQGLVEEEVALFRGQDQAWKLKWSPDGTRIALQAFPYSEAGAHDVRMLVYLASAQGGEPMVLQRGVGDDYALGFTLDSQELLTLNTTTKAAYRWDVVTHALVDSLVLENIDVHPFNALSPDGTKVAVRTQDRQLGVWDLRAHQFQGRLTGFAEPVAQVAFSPDGRWVAVRGTDWVNEIRLWDLRDHSLAANLHSVDGLTGMAFLPDSRRLVISTHGSVWSWDLSLLGEVTVSRSLPLPEKVSALVEAIESLPIIQGFLERTARHSVSIRSLALRADGKILALGMEAGYVLGSDDYTRVGIVLLWDTEAGAPVALLEGPTDEVLGMTFRPDGQQLATVAASNDSLVRLWDLELKQQVRILPAPVPGGYTLAFSPDGQRLALGSAVAFSPDNHFLAAGGGPIRLWDLGTDSPPVLFDAGFHSTTLWDVAQGQKVAELDGFKEYTVAVAFSPDGTVLAEGKGGVLVLRQAVRSTAVESLQSLDQAVPERTTLWPNYPNPFNPQSTIAYQLPQAGPVRLVIYNTLGQRVRVLVDQVQVAGRYQVRWDGTDEAGQALGSGVYLYRLEAGPFRQTRRLVLVR